MVGLSLVFALIAQGQSKEAPQTVKASEMLIELCRVTKSAFIVDIGSDMAVPASIANLPARARLEALARTVNRSLTQDGYIYLLKRSSADAFQSQRDETLKLLEWLSAVPKDKMDLMISDSVSSSTLGRMKERILASLTADPEQLSTIMAADRDVRIGVRLTLAVEVASEDGKSRFQTLPVAFNPISHDLKSNPTSAGTESLTPSGPGLIEFGSGKVMTLREVLDYIRPSLTSSIRYDRRLDSTKYFVSGSYGSEAFVSNLISVLHVDDLTLDKKLSDNVQFRLQQLLATLSFPESTLSPALRKLGLKDILSGKSLEVSQLASASPYFADLAKRYQLEGVVRCRPAIAITVDPGGMRPGSNVTNGFIYIIH